MNERTGLVTFKGNPITLVGNQVKVSDQAPNFQALQNDLSIATLDSFKGVRIISAVPSLDTGYVMHKRIVSMRKQQKLMDLLLLRLA